MLDLIFLGLIYVLVGKIIVRFFRNDLKYLQEEYKKKRRLMIFKEDESLKLCDNNTQNENQEQNTIDNFQFINASSSLSILKQHDDTKLPGTSVCSELAYHQNIQLCDKGKKRDSDVLMCIENKTTKSNDKVSDHCEDKVCQSDAGDYSSASTKVKRLNNQKTTVFSNYTSNNDSLCSPNFLSFPYSLFKNEDIINNILNSVETVVCTDIRFESIPREIVKKKKISHEKRCLNKIRLSSNIRTQSSDRECQNTTPIKELDVHQWQHMSTEARKREDNPSHQFQNEPQSFEFTQQVKTESINCRTYQQSNIRPMYPSYASFAVRIISFTDWPATMTQNPHDMALAGFFYAGFGDTTRCFFCGGGLRNWEAGDDPWAEHATWFPYCEFLRENRGQKYIDHILKRAAKTDEEQIKAQREDQSDEINANENVIMIKDSAIQIIRGVGYNDDTIKAAINIIKNRFTKGEEVSAADILNVIFELEDESTQFQYADSGLGEYGQDEGNPCILNDLGSSIRRENSRLKDQVMCKICLAENVSIVFLPCGHLVCCSDCAPAMLKCPICSMLVMNTSKVYLARL